MCAVFWDLSFIINIKSLCSFIRTNQERSSLWVSDYYILFPLKSAKFWKEKHFGGLYRVNILF